MDASNEFLREYKDNLLYYPALPPEMEDRYDLSACLKYTDQKQVYLICGKSDGKKYIMKYVNNKTGLENLKAEYELQSSLNHKGIASVVEFIEGDTQDYLIREYIEGYTITELVEMTRDGHLTEAEAAKVIVQLCGILQYLHSQNPPIIHRDIKPDNVIYTKAGEVKLIDFGISRRFSLSNERDTLIMGTGRTAPPEQYGYRQTDARSDIYSIGILLFYMVTGSLDINEMNESTISANLRDIIIKCTEFSPNDRYGTMSQLERRLNKYLDKTGHSRGWISAGLAVLLFLPATLLILLQGSKKDFFASNGADGAVTGLDADAGQDTEEVLSSFELRRAASQGQAVTGQPHAAQASPEPASPGQTGPEPPSNSQTEMEQLNKGQTEMELSSKDQAELEQSNKGPTEMEPSNGGQAELEQSNKGQAESEKAEAEHLEIGQRASAEQPAAEMTNGGKAVSEGAFSETPYVFRSPLIEAAVRHELGRSDSEAITLHDLDQIEELYICGEQVYNTWGDHFVYGENQYMNNTVFIEANKYRNQGSIDSLEDVAQMHHIRTLELFNQKISDISPLKGLSYLSRLGLGANNISDISVLGSLQELQVLNLAGNPLDDYDMGVLSELPALKELDIGATAVTSLRGIKQINLKKLSLFGVYLGDCAGLDEMQSLEALILNGIGIGITEAGMARVIKLAHLTELRIMGSQTFDLSILTALSGLNYLDLCDCRIESIDALKGLNLNVLYFDLTEVKDISVLEYFPDLEFLGMKDIPCKDYTPLRKLSKLRFVACNQRQIDMIKEQLQEAPYQFWIQQ